MGGLYRGKYLIALYDENDNLLEVGNYPKELSIFSTINSANSHIAHVFAGRRTDNRIHFIDVTEKHDDIFAEEDREFLKFFKNAKRKSDRVKAEMLGVSLRTYMRYKANGTLYKLEKKLKAKGGGV